MVSHSISSAQIFDYLPQVLKFPFNENPQLSEVMVNRIVPFGSLDVNYIISVAEVYFPADVVDTLLLLLGDTSSKLYQNKDATTNMLAQLIDIRIPLTGLNTAARPTAAPQSDNGSVGSSDSKTLNSGVVAGIAVGASIGSLAYMSLMVLLFRRYKKKNIELMSTDSESRVDSDHSNRSPVSSQTGKFQISVPVNALNSLGWAE